jgi:hypothetical protein
LISFVLSENTGILAEAVVTVIRVFEAEDVLTGVFNFDLVHILQRLSGRRTGVH